MANEKRLIDANEIAKVAEHAYKEWNLAMAAADGQRQINQVYKMKELCKAVKAVADAAPTVDAVEVVRCKDCHWWRHINKRNGCGICQHEVFSADDCTVDPVTEPDDFCSYGERKEERT